MAYNGYRDLKVWQKSIVLTVLVYRASQKFPVEERYGITSQMRRASVSVPSNIAEGHGRSTSGEYRHALSIARGSLKELETLCELAYKLGYLNTDAYGELLDACSEISRMLTGLKRAIRR